MAGLPGLVHGAALVAQTPGLAPLVRPSLYYPAILPELILIGGAALLLVVASLARRRLPTAFHTAFTIVVALAAMGATYYLWRQVEHGGSYTAWSGAIAVDGFSLLFLILVGASLILGALVSNAWQEREGQSGPELYVLAMLSASGAMFMAAGNDLILIFLGLEIMSFPLYVLAGLDSRRAESGEAAMKYFILGAFSSALFLYGVALTYGATGSTNLAHVASFLASNVVTANGLILAGLALLLVGFGFKVALVPFHTWTPDVYQGSPSPITGYMAAVAKAGGFAGLLRVFFSTFSTLRLDWQPAIWLLAVATLVVGSVLAVVQSDIKRMLAYSSISHAGFVLVGLYAASNNGISGSLYYLLTYAFMVLGSFAVVTVIGRTGDAAHHIETYRGLARRRPGLAIAFAVLLMAQAGIPFTTGFLAKFYVIAAVVQRGSYALALIAMVSAVVAAFFYLRVIVVMYAPAERAPAGARLQLAVPGAPEVGDGNGSQLVGLRSEAAELGGRPVFGSRPGAPVAVAPAPASVAAGPAAAAEEETPVPVPLTIAIVLAITVVFTVFFGFYPAPVIDFARRATLLF